MASSNVEALGMIECKGFVALVEACDAMLKAANVDLVGWDKIGSGLVTAFVAGDVAAVKAAIDAGAAAASRIGEVVSVQVIPRPHEDLASVLSFTQARPGGQTPPHHQRQRSLIDMALATNQGTGLATHQRSAGDALGLIETKGLVGMIEATDAMLKAANVSLVSGESASARPTSRRWCVATSAASAPPSNRAPRPPAGSANWSPPTSSPGPTKPFCGPSWADRRNRANCRIANRQINNVVGLERGGFRGVGATHQDQSGRIGGLIPPYREANCVTS